MPETIGDRFRPGWKIMGVGDDFAESIGVADQAAVSVVVVANRLNAARIVNRQQTMSCIVSVG
jgi:hypothetical protein